MSLLYANVLVLFESYFSFVFIVYLSCVNIVDRKG